MATEERIPGAVWEGSFRIFGLDVKCFVLDDGRRIIEADSARRLFDAICGDGTIDRDEMKAFANWLNGIG